MIFMVLGGLIYLVSPVDLIPEAVFGILGFFDDIGVLIFTAAALG